MWDINLKAPNEQDNQRLRDMDNGLVVTRGEEASREVDGVKGVKYVGIERNLTMGGEHRV